MTIAVISMIRDAWGGSEELWYEMAKEALKEGHSVIHLAYEHPHKHPKIKELENLGLIRLTRPGWIPTTTPAGRFLHLSLNYMRKKVANPIKRLLQQKPDVIIYNGTCYSVAAEKQLLRYLAQPQYNQIPFYIIAHLNHDLLRDISDAQAHIVKKAYLHCKKVFFVSERSIETAQRHLCATINNSEIVRNPVNLSATTAIPFPNPEGIIQLAMVGNLVTIHKGQDLMLHALSKWQETGWRLNIYGSGYDLQYLKDLTCYLQLEDKVTFHGSVDDIRKVWQHNHVLLMPSHFEGMPLAVVEAMLCGRICIVTNVGGHKEWLTHGKNGFIAEAPTIDALLKALETAWKYKEDWAQMGKEAHAAAIKLYDPHAGKTLLNRIIAE